MIIVLSMSYIKGPYILFEFIHVKEYTHTYSIMMLVVINMICLIDIVFRLFQGYVDEKENLPYVSINIDQFSSTDLFLSLRLS